MSCILRVIVPSAKLSSVMAIIDLNTDRVWHKGETDAIRREPNLNSGFTVMISEAENFRSQIEEALSFVRVNGTKLSALNTDVDSVVLDFGISVVGDKAGEYYSFPCELVQEVAAINGSIELSRYVIDG